MDDLDVHLQIDIDIISDFSSAQDERSAPPKLSSQTRESPLKLNHVKLDPRPSHTIQNDKEGSSMLRLRGMGKLKASGLTQQALDIETPELSSVSHLSAEVGGPL